MPFSPSEIRIAAKQMKLGKSSALATFQVKQFLRYRDTNLCYAMLCYVLQGTMEDYAHYFRIKIQTVLF